MPVNKSYSVLWLKTDWDMPNLLYCIHLGDLPQKLLDTSVKKKYWKQLDPILVISLPAQPPEQNTFLQKKNYRVR